MKTLVATILILMLCGCARNGDQNNRQAESIRQGDLSRPFATEQIPVPVALRRDVVPAPVAAAAPEKQSEPRAEVVPLPADIEVDSTASNNANQQSATGVVTAQMAKFAESIDASLVKLDSKIVAQNEMVANLRADVRIELNAQATAVANLRADVKAEMSALASAQAGVANQQSTATAGRDMTTQFSDGMERLMSRMVGVIDSIVLAFVGTFFGSLVSMLVALVRLLREFARLRERDEKRDDQTQQMLISLISKGLHA